MPAGAGAPVVEPSTGERRRLLLSFAYFGLLLASYYMIRPLRDALAAGSGPSSIKYLASIVFVVMLAIVPIFGWLVARLPRTRLVPLTYGFFAINLAVFGTVFNIDPGNLLAARAFYVWTTVFNLFVVSVFWSFMAEIWREEEGRRLFGVIAAGGSLGGIVGPLLTRMVLPAFGTAGVAFSAAILLLLTLAPIALLGRERRIDARTNLTLNEPVGGEIFAGITRLARSPFLLGVGAMVVLGSLLGMIVYIELARFANVLFTTPAARTAFYAQRDLWVNGVSFLVQFAVVGALTRRFGVRTSLLVSVLGAVLGFTALLVMPVLGVLVFVNIALRALEFGLGKPSRDMLYTVVDAETKYKVKNVIDTMVYRASDAVSGWVHDALVAAGASLGALAGLCGMVCAALGLIAWRVGTGYRNRGGR